MSFTYCKMMFQNFIEYISEMCEKIGKYLEEKYIEDKYLILEKEMDVFNNKNHNYFIDINEDSFEEEDEFEIL